METDDTVLRKLVDPRTGRLEGRLLHEYLAQVGSAIFAVFPGVAEGGYLGQRLFQ